MDSANLRGIEYVFKGRKYVYQFTKSTYLPLPRSNPSSLISQLISNLILSFLLTMSPFTLHTLALLTTLTSLSSARPTINATCDKEILSTAASAYISSQTTGTLTKLNPFLASNWTYMENNKQISHMSGVLHKSLQIDHFRTNYDLVDCATYTELVSASGPYVIGTQIRHAADGKVKGIDTIATTTNAWLFNATKTLEFVKMENWTEIPEGKRDKREVIKAAGDAYMDMWNDAHAHERVPWGVPCVRLEGSAYTGTLKPKYHLRRHIAHNCFSCRQRFSERYLHTRYPIQPLPSSQYSPPICDRRSHGKCQYFLCMGAHDECSR